MLKASTSAPPKLTMPLILGEPPERANAYSDGSVRHPTFIFSTATFGVVWPDRGRPSDRSRRSPLPPRWILANFITMLALQWQAWCHEYSFRQRELSLWAPSLLS